MSNSDTRGTVAPFLPLLPRHQMVLSMVSAAMGNMPDGIERSNSNDVTVTDQAAFDEWALNAADDPLLDGDLGELELAKAGLLQILESGEDLTDDLTAVHHSKDSDYIGPSGEKLYYLYAETGAGGWALEFLGWVIQDMPEEIRFISFEYACTCDKMRPGEFGGGAWFVHRGGVEFINTGSWLHEMEELLKKREGAGESVMDLMSQLNAVEKTTLHYPEKDFLGADLTEMKNLLARAAAFMEDNGSISDKERVELLEDLVQAVDEPEDMPDVGDEADAVFEAWSPARQRANAAVIDSDDLEPDGGRCEHGMFFGGAGACPQCGRGAD